MKVKCSNCNKEVEVKTIEEKIDNDTLAVNIVCTNCNNKTVAYYLNDEAKKLQEEIRNSYGDKRKTLQKELKELMDKLKEENE